MEDKIKRILVSEQEIKARVRELGEEISQDYEGKELVLVCILKGAVMFMADLAREISIPVSFDFMSVQSYGSKSYSSGEVRIIKDLDNSVENKHVLIVEDIVDTGRTLAYLKKSLFNRGALSVKVAAFFNKYGRREIEVKPDYVGIDLPNEFIIGYGLDYNQLGRNLPYVGSLKEEVYKDEDR